MKKYLPLFLIVLIITLCLQLGCDKDEPIISGLPVIVPPTQITPANGAVSQSDSISFTWRKVIGVTGYTLQVSLDSNFSYKIYNQSGLTDTIKQIYSLANFRTYFWRVNSVLYNTVTPWSTVWRFTKVVIMNIPCPGTPTVSYAGKTYNTVLIRNQCWLRENLNIGTMVDSLQNQTDNGTIEKYCYNNDTSNCNTYGGLYQWNEAMKYYTIEGTQGICPAGWRIPTYNEYQTLKTTVVGDGNALKAIGQGIGGGVGTDTSGFSALLSGNRYNNGNFYVLGSYAYFWSSTNYGSSYAYYMHMNYLDSYIGFASYYKNFGFSVRCIKD
jgi:uncharacterized protein (TIGR02145 family)